MRRPRFGGAVVVLALLAFAAPATAQYAAPQAGGSVKTSPTRAGTKARPASLSVTTTITTNAEQSRISTNRIVLLLARQMRFDGRGLKASEYCPATRINARGVEACSARSEIGAPGANRVDVVLFPRLIPVTLTQRIFLASRNQVTIHLASQTPGININKAITGIVSAAGAPYGQKITIDIPPDLVQPVPGTYAGIKLITFTVRRRTLGTGRSRHPLLGLSSCPADRMLRWGGRATLVGNPNPPSTGFIQATTTSPCRR